jgi:hypothetical protein
VFHYGGYFLGLQESWKLLALVALGGLQVGLQPHCLEESWLCVEKRQDAKCNSQSNA